MAVLAGAQVTLGQTTAGATSATKARSINAVPGGPVRTVTLITGDRVTVDGADAARYSIVRGKGREHVTFAATRAAGHLRVVPSDAVGPLRDGLLDRRLFDVTTLLDSGYDDGAAELPLIVTYADGVAGQTARAGPATAGARVVRALPGKGNFAVRAARSDAGAFWRSLSVGARGTAATSGIRKVWLDGLRKPTLVTSVPQIGAPGAWQAVYTGKGVTVAVLDTGVDGDHPDLAGRVTASKNFTEGLEDDRDLVGHGTHVASTVAGSGTASGGSKRGVAQDANLVTGKVCAVFGCAESWIIAGMQWAVTNSTPRSST